MTELELDRALGRLLLDAIRRDEERAEDGGPAFRPTAGYARQMALMVRDPLGWARRRARPAWRGAVRRAAVILLAGSLSLGGLMAASPTVRSAVIRWAAEWYDTHIVYRYAGETIAGEMPRYEITALPEGYVETVREERTASVSVVYESDTGDLICFDYTYMQQGAANVMITGEDDVKEISVNQMDGELFLPHDPESAKTITWIDASSNIQFVIKAFCGENDILNMAEQVILVKTEN